MSHGWPMVDLDEVLRQVVDRCPLHADQVYPTFAGPKSAPGPKSVSGRSRHPFFFWVWTSVPG
jgi:hypothetical protein